MPIDAVIEFLASNLLPGALPQAVLTKAPRSVFLCGFCRLFRKLFVTATLALPQRKDRVRVAGTLVDRALRRNDFAATSRASTSARGTTINVDLQKLRVVVGHESPATATIPFDAYTRLRRSRQTSTPGAPAKRARPNSCSGRKHCCSKKTRGTSRIEQAQSPQRPECKAPQ
jgi:hypothetical protein